MRRGVVRQGCVHCALKATRVKANGQRPGRRSRPTQRIHHPPKECIPTGAVFASAHALTRAPEKVRAGGVQGEETENDRCEFTAATSARTSGAFNVSTAGVPRRNIGAIGFNVGRRDSRDTPGAKTRTPSLQVAAARRPRVCSSARLRLARQASKTAHNSSIAGAGRLRAGQSQFDTALAGRHTVAGVDLDHGAANRADELLAAFRIGM